MAEFGRRVPSAPLVVRMRRTTSWRRRIVSALLAWAGTAVLGVAGVTREIEFQTGLHRGLAAAAIFAILYLILVRTLPSPSPGGSSRVGTTSSGDGGTADGGTWWRDGGRSSGDGDGDRESGRSDDGDRGRSDGGDSDAGGGSDGGGGDGGGGD
jgi:hypothetical protein